ncbi:MAG TPA: N-acetylgalactosamine 6-sulfate sulfatase, partial [Planctomycetaceae bacterium]|nr:N-acetylgalactosamine 6-sulfate sulfatase [Planctomycetaceae bacterium]
MVDDMGYGDPGCFNSKTLARTPEIDAMAAGGMRFTRFYAAAPVCSPTRGSCLTGRHPYRYGIYSANTGHLPREEVTISELLKNRGYTT